VPRYCGCDDAAACGFDLPRTLGSWTLVVMAFAGSLAVTLLVRTVAAR
jgi:hypothetical protein